MAPMARSLRSEYPLFKNQNFQDLPSHNTGLMLEVAIRPSHSQNPVCKPIETGFSSGCEVDQPKTKYARTYAITRYPTKFKIYDFAIPFFFISSIFSWLMPVNLIHTFPNNGPYHIPPITMAANAATRIAQ